MEPDGQDQGCGQGPSSGWRWEETDGVEGTRRPGRGPAEMEKFKCVLWGVRGQDMLMRHESTVTLGAWGMSQQWHSESCRGLSLRAAGGKVY